MEPRDLDWSELTRQYARQFSELVAYLGRHRDVGAETVALWQRIKELQALCVPLEKEIDRRLGLDKQYIASAHDQLQD